MVTSHSGHGCVGPHSGPSCTGPLGPASPAGGPPGPKAVTVLEVPAGTVTSLSPGQLPARAAGPAARAG